MNEKLIQKALFDNFSSHKYRFTNAYYFENESDFLSFMPNGYCYEVEIKISRSDFKADFKKVKHNIHSSNEKGNLYYLEKFGFGRVLSPSWELCRLFPELIESQERNTYRHGIEVTTWLNASCKIDIKEVKNTKLPNKFFYAVPTGLISKEEIPDYAGLLYIDENLKVTKIKDGKFIHKDVLPPERIFNKTYYGYETLLREQFRKITQSKTKL